MSVFFIGCLHFGHKWMATHRGFQDEFYHDEHIIEQWNKVINKKDLVWILGDVTMEDPKHYYRLDALNGRKKAVLGNHDLPQDTRELLKYVETVAGMVDYKGYILTHCPVHPNEMSFCRGNIHAHIHENLLEECIVSDRYGDSGLKSETLAKYFNVDAHRIGYTPLSMDEITEAMGQKDWVKPQKAKVTWEI
jgi:calcineurin-like phosphoesterase family protein